MRKRKLYENVPWVRKLVAIAPPIPNKNKFNRIKNTGLKQGWFFYTLNQGGDQHMPIYKRTGGDKLCQTTG